MTAAAIVCAAVFVFLTALSCTAVAQEAGAKQEQAADAKEAEKTPEATTPGEPAAETKEAEGSEDKKEEEDAEPVQTVAPSSDILRYGADLEGGAPYVFQDHDNPDKLVGFEVDLIDEIAKQLGRKPVHVQNDWDKLVPGLSRDLYDVAIQGLEVTPEHEEVVAFSVPYYITSLQLAVRKDMFLINSLEDCHGRVVGTLKESQAQYILESLKDVDVRSYATEVNGFDDLANGRLDAVLFDAPVALYYATPRPELKLVSEPIGRIIYGMAMRKDNAELVNKINEILTKMKENGQLRNILDRWGLWNSLVANEFEDFSRTNTPATKLNEWLEFQKPVSGWKAKFDRYAGFLPIFGKGAIVTMEISILAMVLAIVWGFLLAVIRVYAPTFLGVLAVLYIEIVRGTPVLIQLFFIFYGLPALGIKFSPFVAGIMGLGLNYAAYEAENYRAGLISVPASQMQAALALGMTRWQAIRFVIAPQAVRVSLPPVTNDFISLLKDSSLVSVITMVELTKVYGQVATTYYDYFGTGIMVAVIYLLLGLPFVRLARWTEKRLAVGYARHGH